jgi:hypothetical protein
MAAPIGGIVLGIWLMASPGVLDFGGAARASAIIAGALAASLSWIALSEVTRPVHRLNLGVGLWLILSAFALGQPLPAAINSVVVGLLLGLLARLPSRIRGNYGGGWRNA